MKLFILTNAPTFDTTTANKTVLDFLNPIINFGLWAVPLLGILAGVVVGVRFLLDDEERRDQKPIWKRLQPILIGTIIVWSLPIIFKIFGLDRPV